MMKAKTNAHCSVRGCYEMATLRPHDEFPHIGFCDRHARRVIIDTVRSIVDGTHPDLLRNPSEPHGEAGIQQT